ncbi:MAG TPA: alpha/beta hydrolase [Candidatus Cybelea sp.]|nr:alpha/beta hydrolase [Candidatus Cybelea sp.]
MTATYEHKYAEVNGIKLHYATAGKGPLMLFVHGFPEFWYTWRHQLAEFAKDHRVVAPDMRGYNLSDKPKAVEQYAARHIIEDLRQLVLHLGEKRCVVVAHDWGGAIAWGFAIQHPELVAKLVIVNAPHPAVFARELRENPKQAQASQYMLFFRSEQAEAVLSADNFKTLWERTYERPFKQGHLNEADKRAYLAAWGQPGALTGGLNWYRASPLRPPKAGGDPSDVAPKLDPALFQVKVPTLVIWGMQDTALPPGNLDGLDKFVADLRIRRIDDATHWVLEERPAEVNAAIREFL